MPNSENKDAFLRIRLVSRDRARCQRLAMRAERTLADWARRALVKFCDTEETRENLQPLTDAEAEAMLKIGKRQRPGKPEGYKLHVKKRSQGGALASKKVA